MRKVETGMSTKTPSTEQTFLADLRAELIRDESRETKPYFDSEGFVSIGIGRNLVGNPLTDEERAFGKKHGWGSDAFIELLYSNDIGAVFADLDRNFPWWRTMPAPRRRGLANMRFQLGRNTFRDFKKSLTLLEAGRFADAGRELRKSLWYRQTPLRAERTIALIET